MTEPDDKIPAQIDKEADHLKEDTNAMDRFDRAIPLPSSEDEDDGVGPITGLVP